MRIKTSFTLAVVAILGIATTAFAESAPVYDADSIQEQFENAGSANDIGPDVPPPAPGQEVSAFVPVPPAGASAVAVVPAAPSSGSHSGKPAIEKRVKRLEQQLSNAEGGEGGAKVDSLQEEVQTLRGQVDQLNHQLQQLQDQQKSLYSDVDKRLSEASAKPLKKPLKPGVSVDSDASGAADTDADTATTTAKSTKAAKTTPSKDKDNTDASTPATVASAAAAAISSAPATPDEGGNVLAGQPNVAEEQQIYQTAYNLIKAKKYSQAVTSLQDMLKKYPSGQFASNAHYWLGELFGLMNKNDNALTEFTVVVSKYPDSPRVSDAQLKIGLIYAAESNWSEAKTAFKKVVNHYPGTASARVASEQLKAIKQAGN